ncbi:MAG: TIGR02301 family protein [Beijerinckiaceae bacterium]
MKLFKPKGGLVFCMLIILAANMAAGHCASVNEPRSATTEAAKPPPAVAMPPSGEDLPPSYERRLLRLAEILGALAYLQDLCAEPDAKAAGQMWRAQMTALMDAEGKTALRKERLAGAYNRGFRGYEASYRRCTLNAQAVITRFLDESGKLAHDIAQHAGPS